MAGELNEQQLCERWGTSRQGLEKLIARGLLTVTEEKGQLKFSEDDVVALERNEGGEDFLSLDEAKVELHLRKEEIEKMVASGKLPRYTFGGEMKFHKADLEAAVGMAELGGDEGADVASAATIPATGDAKLDLGKAGAKGKKEEDLFDFGEDLGKAVEEAAAKPGRPSKKEEFPETDMITEIVDVSGADSGEEDILGDIIEDVGAEADLTSALDDEPTAAPTGDDTVDAETSQEPTAEITELEEMGEAEPGEEVTAEITQLEEETFEGEELENILAGEEEAVAGEAQEEEFEGAYGAPVATVAEPPIPTWTVALLVATTVIMIIGWFYVMESLNPKYSTGITKSLSLFKEE